jgi:hypothetical protein
MNRCFLGISLLLPYPGLRASLRIRAAGRSKRAESVPRTSVIRRVRTVLLRLWTCDRSLIQMPAGLRVLTLSPPGVLADHSGG